MKLSDSPKVELLRLERLAVQNTLTIAQQADAAILLNGQKFFSGQVHQAAREAICQACSGIIMEMDKELLALGVQPD